MLCDLCTENHSNSTSRCCWTIAMDIKNFKRRVLRLYIWNTLFDMTVSIASVVIDIVILIRYTQKGKWPLAILTALPVLLPTIVFANVYMSDGNHNQDKIGGSQNGPFKMITRGIKRFAKYFWGTFILRFIAWTWYLKALVFGVKALKRPKKFMTMEQPDIHWSRDLLVRLDFFQAALENAPQCVIQLYVLLTDASEDKVLGCLTLCFAFLDFIRVATTVRWNFNRGPVLAPTEHESRIWKLLNVASWCFLYVARCAAMSLIVGTTLAAKGLILIIPVTAVMLHCAIISILISRLKLGQVSKKLLVTTFISIFFLPDLDNKDTRTIVQFYYFVYVMTLIENILMLVPWGYDLSFTGFCFIRMSNGTTIDSEAVTIPSTGWMTTEDFQLNADTGFEESECLIDPVFVVLIVPTLTVAGVLFRMWSAQKMNSFQNSLSAEDMRGSGSEVTVEDKWANIYSRKWTKISIKELWTAFVLMIRKEVVPNSTNKYQIATIQSTIDEEKFTSGINRKSILTGSEDLKVGSPLVLYHEKWEKIYNLSLNQTGKCLEQNWMHKTLQLKLRRLSYPVHSSSFNDTGHIFQNLNAGFLKIETESGFHIFETVHI